MIIYITGLSSAGKTTTCREMIKLKGYYNGNFLLLDNDEVRRTVNNDLSFDAAGRHENIRRVTEIACICSKQGYDVLCAFTAPTNHLKKMAKDIAAEKGQKCFIVNLDCPITICAERNNNGMYEKSEGNKISEKCGTPDMAETDYPGLVDLHLDSSKSGLLHENIIKILDLIKQEKMKEHFS